MPKEAHLPECRSFLMPFPSAEDIPSWTLDIRGCPSSDLNTPVWAKKILLPHSLHESYSIKVEALPVSPRVVIRFSPVSCRCQRPLVPTTWQDPA